MRYPVVSDIAPGVSIPGRRVAWGGPGWPGVARWDAEDPMKTKGKMLVIYW